MQITKKEIMIVGGVVVLIVIVVLVGFWLYGNGGLFSGSTQSLESGNLPATSTTSGPPPGPVPVGTTVPNEGAANTPANVAVPVVQAPANPSGDTTYRSFNINIKGGAYSPSTVIVKEGDIVNLRLTAVDANYGFAQSDYGFNTAIAQGKTKTIQFQAVQVGDFAFYCPSCGGPSKGPVGHIIVTAK
jgi:plastocyanin